MKTPAFQFYPGDWLSSQRVQMMTLEEEGAYIRLLCYCWSHGSIPSDPAKIARLVGKSCSLEVATSVQRMFNERSTDDATLVHDRLERERVKQTARREQTVEAGKKSAQSRKNHAEPLQNSTPVERAFNGSSNFVEREGNPSSSASTSALAVLLEKEPKCTELEFSRPVLMNPKPLPPHRRIGWTPETGWVGFNDTDLKLFADAAPAVEIGRALSAADLWLRANPAKAKKQNFYRFFANWLVRHQERGGDSSRATNGSTPREAPKSFAQQDREAKEAARHGPWVVIPKVLSLTDP